MGAIKGQHRFTRMVQLAEIIFAVLFPDWTVVLVLLLTGVDRSSRYSRQHKPGCGSWNLRRSAFKLGVGKSHPVPTLGKFAGRARQSVLSVALMSIQRAAQQ